MLSSAMSTSNNRQTNAAPMDNVRELNLTETFPVHEDFQLDVEDTDVDTQLKLGASTPLDTQLKLGPSRRHAVENTDVDTQLKLEFSKDPVEYIDVSESVNSVDTQLSFSVHQDFPLPVEVAATTEAGDGAIPITGKKRKISGDEGCSKWNDMEDDSNTHAKTVTSEDLFKSSKSDVDLVEECHITPTAATELVAENEQMADAPEIGALCSLRRSTRSRKPNARLKGHELHDPKTGYYIND